MMPKEKSSYIPFLFVVVVLQITLLIYENETIQKLVTLFILRWPCYSVITQVLSNIK